IWLGARSGDRVLWEVRIENDRLVLRSPMSHQYRCTYNAVKYGSKSCLSVDGGELDRVLERAVLSTLQSPTLEVLREALAEARRAEEIEKARIEAERERLEYHIKQAGERFENADPKFHRVYHDLQEKLDQAMKELEDFEQRQTINPSRSKILVSKEELEELCDLAAEVPKIWHHREVTSRDRKEIIACVVESVSVITNAEKVKGTIRWKAGEESTFEFYRRAGKYSLVKELHAGGCNTREILECLQAGQTSTGQSMKLHVESLYKICKRLG